MFVRIFVCKLYSVENYLHVKVYFAYLNLMISIINSQFSDDNMMEKSEVNLEQEGKK